MKELVTQLIEMLQAVLKALAAAPAKAVEAIAPAPKGRPDYVALAELEIGTKEIKGGENKRIIEYHSATKLKASEDEVAWCSSFINWLMMKCGYERSHSAAARSWLSVGTKLKGFEKYAIVVFKRGNSAWQGHVAIAIDETKDGVRVLGGNQSNSVSYATYRKSDVLGYFRPKKLK
jgi:uncharacterized protein (TIGR02594 family)